MAQDTRATEERGGHREAEVLTFLIADVRGFTRFTQEHGDEAASELAKHFAETVRVALPAFGGDLLEVRGDEALCVFGSARQALRASVELQRGFRTRAKGKSAFPLGVGIGLDAGEAVPTDGGYRGKALNLAARLCALAGPGQILATESVVHLAHRVEGLTFVARRAVRLKGVDEPVRLVEVRPIEELPPVPLPPKPRTRRQQLWIAAALLTATAGVVGGLALAGVFSGNAHEARSAALPVAGIYRIGLASNRVVQVIPLSPEKRVDEIRIGNGALWVGGLLKGTPNLQRVDPRTGHVATIPGGGAPFALGLGKIFVYGGVPGNRTNFATVIDADNPTNVPNVIELQPFKDSQAPGPLEFAVGSLWAWEYGQEPCCIGEVLWRVDPNTDHVLARWLNPSGEAGYTFNVQQGVGFGPDGVWRVRNGNLSRIYSPVGKRAAVVRGLNANGVAVGGGAVWTVSPSGTLTEISPSTGTIAWSQPFSATIDSVVVGEGSVWLEDRRGQTITRVDIATHHIFEPIKLARAPGPMAIDQNGLWVAFPPGDWPI